MPPDLVHFAPAPPQKKIRTSHFHSSSLVSTYVVCERLSVTHQQAKLPEIFDQIPQNTWVFWNLVPEHSPGNEILPRVQI